MMSALQKLVDNGLSDAALIDLLYDLVEIDYTMDPFDDNDDRQCCIALLYDRLLGPRNDPSGYAVVGINVNTPSADYLVYNEDDANDACKMCIEETLWAFCPSFLNQMTGISQTVFEALLPQCEDANDAVRSIIDGSCGIDAFVEAAVGAETNGRGHFLACYDHEERELSVEGGYYYLYKTD